MRRILCLLFLAIAFPTLAQRTTLTITVTNRAVTSNGLTIGSAFRYFTNAQSSTTFATNLTSINATKTNVFNQIAAFPYTAITLQDVGTNSFRVVSGSASLASVLLGEWGYITTNSSVGPSNTVPMVYPFSQILGATNQTNQGSAIVDGLSNYTTNRVSTNAVSMGNFLQKGAGTQQVVIGDVQFNAALRASPVDFTNGFFQTVTGINLVTSNLVNYGNAIRSEGSGGNSLQLGSNAVASGDLSLAVGNSALAGGESSTAVGNGAQATSSAVSAFGRNAIADSSGATAIGDSAQAIADSATAIGASAVASGSESFAGGALVSASGANSTSVGAGGAATAYAASQFGGGAATAVFSLALGPATASHSNSVALGPPDHAGNATATTATNQIRVATANHTVSIPGQLLISGTQSNTTFRGTNVAGGSWSYPRFDLSTLAAGNNLAVPIGTNRFIRFGAGPASAATIVGMVGGALNGGLDGQDIVVFNDTAFTLTFAVNAVDPVPANRINTPSGGDVSIPDQGWANFFYDGTDSRWKLVNAFSGTNLLVTTTTTNAIYAVMTNGVLVSGAATNLNIIVSTADAILATNTSGKVDMQIVLTAGAGEANFNGEVSITNATRIGLVHSKSSVTNRLRSVMGGNGIVLTNEGTNVMFAIDPAVVASQANLTAASNAHVAALAGKVDELNGVATNLTVYTGSPGLTVWQLPGAATNSWQVMRTNGGRAIVFVNSNNVFTASNMVADGTIAATGTISSSGNINALSGGDLTDADFGGDKVLVSSGANVSESATIDTTELGYLNGVTSDLQTQLNTKVETNHNTALGTNFITHVADIGTPDGGDLIPIVDVSTATRKYVQFSAVAGSGDAGGTNSRQGGHIVLTNLVGTVAKNVTNENSTALQIDAGTLTLSAGNISNLNANAQLDFVASGAGAKVWQGVSPTNNVTVTNLSGVVHVLAATVLAFDFNQAHEFVQTNRSGAAQSIILTNGADGQSMSGILLGEVAGGTSRVMTFIPNTGQLIEQVGDYTTGLATSLALTLTNGLAVEWSSKVRRVNGTNIHHFAFAYYKH